MVGFGALVLRFDRPCDDFNFQPIKTRDDALANATKLIEEKKGSETVITLEKLLRTYETEAGNVRDLLKQARK